MRTNVLAFWVVILSLVPGLAASPPTIAEKTKGMEPRVGFHKWFWDETEGKIWLEVDQLNEEFLLVSGMATGIGSNDIGLDRAQLGSEKVVEFRRSGPTVLLVQPNLLYRADFSGSDLERRAVREGFAESVLWGFKVAAEEDGRILIDWTPVLFGDHQHIGSRLERMGEGSYSVDESRSGIYLPNCRSFPRNDEFEVTLTMKGSRPGPEIRSVTPTPEFVSVRQHLSLIELPDATYRRREYHVLSGYFPLSYVDYTVPIGSDLTRRFITRHRLEKMDPAAELSDPVQPIVYYLDPATPEPVKSALLEGGRWWNDAFESIGYRNAFRIEMLPADADPMDVRYNVINWLHRSTRGWSYGASITDPRTGEILKGHVNLGSLRVRQDYLIAQGLLSPFGDDLHQDDPMLKMALARLRQLSAHEIGHTLGLTHNFAASTVDRSSVMDYPHPLIRLDSDGDIDLADAYAVGVGPWDKVAIAYGYQDFADGVDESAELERILEEGYQGHHLRFLSDGDARPAGSPSPVAHIWDNGANPVSELNHLVEVRQRALEQFSLDSIRSGMPLATLEEVLVPTYFLHRYQATAVSKLVGGLEYEFSLKGDWTAAPQIVPGAEQRRALDALLATLAPEQVAVPERIVSLIPPRPLGYPPHRELLQGQTGLTFDPLGAVEAWSKHVVGLLLNPQRAARLVEYSARDSSCPSMEEMIGTLLKKTWFSERREGYLGEVQRQTDMVVLQELMALAARKENPERVRASAHNGILELQEFLAERDSSEPGLRQAAVDRYARFLIGQYLETPESFAKPVIPDPPPGDPIGTDCSAPL